MINDSLWNATIISPPTITYNCHGYAWHVSDGGINVVITGSGSVENYYSGDSATYIQTLETDTLEKIVYYYDDHSAITTEDSRFVISKWGGGPLVRHLISDCPYDGSTLVYYKLNMSGNSSVPKGTATSVNTLNIQNATYNWIGDNYVCASGGYIASVTGLETTPSYGNGILRVELTSPFSHTTIKGNKYYTVGDAPTPLPTISGDRLVCSSGKNFTLNYLPAGNWVTWSSSSNLSTSDNTTNPCTFVATGNGSGWVRATLHTQCSQKNLTDYIIWAGTPAVDVTGPSVGSVGNSYTFYEYPSTYSSPTSFNWTLSPYCDGNSIYNYGYWANAVFYGDGGYYQIGCTPTNSCGTGSMATTYIDIYDSDFYIISPNPASDIVTISVKESSINSANAVYTVRVIDMYGSLYFTSTKSGDSFTFPVNNLKNGSYIVQITDDNKNKTSNLILIVKH